MNTQGNHLILENSGDYLSVEDMLDVQEYGVSDVETRNLTTRDLLKELYKIQFYLYKSNKLRHEPCSICLTRRLGSTRKCRGCGSLSCNRCCIDNWYPMTSRMTRHGNYNIEDKRCNLCHMKCSSCNEVYPRSDTHQCIRIVR